MIRITLFLVVVLASAFSVSLSRAQTAPSDEEARVLAIETVAKATGISKAELTTKRMEGLEDNLFFSQVKIAGRIKKGVYFYKVENGGWQITPDEAIYRGSGSQIWYVAISTMDGEAFGLFGFKDADTAFQQLVAKIPVDVKDAIEAKIFAKFYLEVVYQTRANIVYDELWLKNQAEDHFVGYADSQEPIEKKEQRFRRWWSGFRATKIRSPLAPTARPEGNNRYRVTMKIMQMTVGLPPELWEWSVEIRKDGASCVLDKRIVFPANLKAGQAREPLQ